MRQEPNELLMEVFRKEHEGLKYGCYIRDERRLLLAYAQGRTPDAACLKAAEALWKN